MIRPMGEGVENRLKKRHMICERSQRPKASSNELDRISKLVKRESVLLSSRSKRRAFRAIF